MTSVVKARPRLAGLLVGLVVVALWGLLAVTVFDDKEAVPTPWETVGRAWTGREDLLTSAGYTLAAALKGLVAGMLVAAALAVVAALVPGVSRTLMRVAVAVSAIPIVAIAPVMVVTFEGDVPVVVVAALSVVFASTVALVGGLTSVPAGLVDVTTGFGGNRWRLLVSVRMPHALPALFTALRFSLPAAMIGAILGEFIQGQRGLGVSLVQRIGEGDAAATWAIALTMTLLTTAGVVLIDLVARVTVRWPATEVPPTASLRGSRLRRTATAVGEVVLALAVLLVGWVVFLRVFDVDPFIGKGPADVWEFATAGTFAPDRTAFRDAMGQLAYDAGVGLLVGWGSGILAALVFARWRPVEQALLPVAVAMRTVPIIAILPMITLVVGRSLGAVLVVISLIVFFPTLVLVRQALGAVSGDLLLFARSHDASPTSVLWRLRAPTAVPAMLAALRIAAPAALIGALVAEFLVTGVGLGFRVLSAASRAAYVELWAGTVAVTVLAVLAYAVFDVVERWAVRRFLA